MNELLNNINKTLETQLKRQNEIMQQMLDVMSKPENKFTQILETLVLVAGILGVLNAADIVRHWIIGG